MPTLNYAKKYRCADNHKKERGTIYNDPLWKKLRLAKLMENPLCEICIKKNIVNPAIDVHHIDSFMNYTGLKRIEKAFTYDNLQCVCKECHQNIHNKTTELMIKTSWEKLQSLNT